MATEAKNKATVSVNFGALGGSLMKQTACSSERMKNLDKVKGAILRLAIHGYIPEGQAHKARLKLVREVADEVAKNRNASVERIKVRANAPAA